MGERGRPILFNEKVAGPGKGVAGYQRQREQPPLADSDEEDHKTHSRQRAETMQHARSQPAVFPQIVRPEVRKRFELLIGHAKFRGPF